MISIASNAAYQSFPKRLLVINPSIACVIASIPVDAANFWHSHHHVTVDERNDWDIMWIDTDEFPVICFICDDVVDRYPQLLSQKSLVQLR